MTDASRLRIVRHESDLGSWMLVLCDPHPRLRPYVRDYVATESRIGFLRERHPPTGDAALILNFGAPHRAVDPDDDTRVSLQRTAWVVGLHERYQVSEAVGERSFLVARLTPIGAHRLLGIAMDDLTNRAVELEDLTGASGRRLVAQVRDAATWPQRFAVLDAFIADRLAHAQPAPVGIEWAWQQLDHNAGCLPITPLSRAIGCSRKHLISEFHQHIGLSPKPLARILRFNRAVQVIEKSRRVAWAALAHDCGYYDQAHFIRDFHAFAGSTPGEFLRRRLPDSAGSLRD